MQRSQDAIPVTETRGRSSPKPPTDSQEIGSRKSAALEVVSTGGTCWRLPVHEGTS